ncbi:MAG: hypothetical protein JXQ90_02335 [Cyclobacteriaceae bacterium]
MKKSIYYINTLALAILVSLASCGDPEVFGCMDPDSDNFDGLANMDDGSCAFSGQVVFWYGEAASQFLVDDEAISLTYYVDGEIVGSGAADVYWNSSVAPDCGEQGTVTVSKDLGSAKSLTLPFYVEDQTGHQYYSGNVTFDANTCLALELN